MILLNLRMLTGVTRGGVVLSDVAVIGMTLSGGILSAETPSGVTVR